MFVAGPPVVARLGQKLDKQELGGWEIQLRAGAVDEAVDTEEEAFACARRFLSYLPSSVYSVAAARPAQRSAPTGARRALFDVIPRDRRKVYKMRPIIEAVVDQGSFFEMGQLYGRADHHRPRAPRRLAGGGHGERSVPLRRRLDGRRLPEGGALRRHGRDLPPAGGLSLRLPGLPDRARGREDRRPSARACAPCRRSTRPPCRGARSSSATSFGVAGAAHEPAGRFAIALRLAVGPLGLAAARGRHRGGLSRRHRRGARPQGQAGRDRGRGSTRCARRSAPPRPSGSRRSSTRATRASCCASSPTWPRRCARLVRVRSACGREPQGPGAGQPTADLARARMRSARAMWARSTICPRMASTPASGLSANALHRSPRLRRPPPPTA